MKVFGNQFLRKFSNDCCKTAVDDNYVFKCILLSLFMKKKKDDHIIRPSVILTGEGVTSIAMNAGYLLAGRWITIVVRFIYAVILTRFLGPELYGYLNYGISWYFAFFPVATLSLGIILAGEVGRNRDNSGTVVNQILTARLLSSSLAAILCGVIGFFFEGEPIVKTLLIIFSLALMGRSLWVCAQSVFTAFEATHYSLRQHALFRPLEVIFGLLVLTCGGGVIGVACIHGISWWLQAIHGFFLIHRYLSPIRLDWKWSAFFRFFGIGLPITLGNIFHSWLANGPLVMFRYYGQTDSDLGQLALAMQVYVLLGNLMSLVFGASLPLISRSVSRKDGKDLYFADGMVRFGIILGALAGIAAMGAGEWLVKLFFGNKFHEAGYLLGLVLWLLIPSMCGHAIWSVYMARGRYVWPTFSAGAGAIIFTAAFPWLVNSMGTAGAVVSAGMGISFSTIVLIFIFARSDAFDLRQIILYPFLAVAVALGAYFSLDFLDISRGITLIVCYIILCGCIYVFKIITPYERNALMGAIKKNFKKQDD